MKDLAKILENKGGILTLGGILSYNCTDNVTPHEHASETTLYTIFVISKSPSSVRVFF